MRVYNSSRVAAGQDRIFHLNWRACLMGLGEPSGRFSSMASLFEH